MLRVFTHLGVFKDKLPFLPNSNNRETSKGPQITGEVNMVPV